MYMLVERQLRLHRPRVQDDVTVVSSSIHARLCRSETYMSVLRNKWHDDVTEYQIRESRTGYVERSVHVQLSEGLERQRRGRSRGWRTDWMLGCSRRLSGHRCPISIDIDRIHPQVEAQR